MRGTVFLLLLFIVCFQCAFGQSTGKINYTISNGLQIAGVDQTNPVIYDNDMVLDTPEMFYLWLKANRKEVNLVGNINTRDLYLPPNIVNSHDFTFNEWTESYNKANQLGLKNIPQPIKGSDDWLRKPASGVIEQTQRKDSPGSDLIISEARKASPSKPLVIFVGGQVTSVANAYLKDNSIADKIIVLHIDGWDETMYNGVDYWANEIVMRRMLYINWAGSFVNNRVTWYAPFRPLQVNLNMPANPWTDLLKNNYYGQSYSQWKDVGDGPVVFWFFDHSVWKNVVRRTADKQTTTSNTYDYLLVSDNDYAKYGQMLSSYMNDPANYIPVTTTPPANVPPTVALTIGTSYPIGNVTLSANASDSDGSVSKVEFFNGTTKLGEDVTSPYSLTWTPTAAGTFSITAKATDNNNGQTTSGAVNVTITSTNTPPVVSITSPGNGSNHTTGSTISIAASASDAGGSVSKVEFFLGTTKLGEDLTSPYDFSWTNVPAGTHSITAKATDNQGAVTTSTAISITVTTTTNTLPAVSITSPVNNAVFTAGASVTISANASDTNGSISKVEFFNGATKLGEDASSPFSFAWANVPTGTYSLTAKATDNQNGVSTSTAISITVTSPTNTLPVVSITSPANNAVFAAGASVTISANASDANGSISNVEFFNGATKLGEDASSPFSFAWANVAAGTYSLTAKATDNQNGVSTSTAISITVTPPTNTLPVVSITSPANNAVFAAGASVTISANASDTNGSIGKVEFFNGATKLGEDASSPFSFAWSNVAAGTYSLTAKATDNQNGVSTSAVIVISVTGAAGVPPTVSLTSPANNSTSPAGTPVTLTATASASSGSITKVEFFNGTTKLGEDSTTPYSFTWLNPPAGTHALGAKATDSNAMVATSSLNQFIVLAPNVLPVVSITSPVNNALFPINSSITIAASAADTDGAISKVEFFNGTTKLGEDLTSPYSFTWANVPSGNYSLSAKATDSKSAVVSSGSVNVSVSASPTAPTISITNPVNNAAFDEAAAVTFDVLASTPIGTITKVEFFNGSNKLGEDLTSPYSFTWTNVPAGEFTVIAKATDNLNVASTAQVSIIVSPLNSTPESDAGDDITTSLPVSSLRLVGSAVDVDGNIAHREWIQVSGPANAVLIQNTVGELHLTDLEEGTYVFTFTVRDDQNLEATDEVIVKVIPELSSLENFPRYFSPNNDGINDYWEWPQLDLFANSKLIIMNRFGQPVFESSSYQNNWNGTIDGNPLQEDAYYYIIKLNNADIKGAVRIIR